MSSLNATRVVLTPFPYAARSLCAVVGRVVTVDVRRGVDEEGSAGEDKSCRGGRVHYAHHGVRVLDHLRGDGDRSGHSTGNSRSQASPSRLRPVLLSKVDCRTLASNTLYSPRPFSRRIVLGKLSPRGVLSFPLQN